MHCDVLLPPPLFHDRDTDLHDFDTDRDTEMDASALMYDTADDGGDADRFATEAAKLAVQKLKKAMVV